MPFKESQAQTERHLTLRRKIVYPETAVWWIVVLFGLLGSGLGQRLEADIYVYRDPRSGVVHFTNVPVHSRYRPLFPSFSHSLEKGSYRLMIWELSRRYGVEPALVQAVVRAESAFNPLARSSKGARGLMQLMPETAARYGVRDPYSPRQNLEGGIRHLRFLLEHFRGNLPLVLAAYNAGVGAVKQYGGIPPFPETREYIRRVLFYRQAYLRQRRALSGRRNPVR